jgi:hypothetical protein
LAEGLPHRTDRHKPGIASACGYSPVVKQIWTGRVAQVAGKYGEHAPTAAVCCNACRTCVTTNLIGIVIAGAGAVGYGTVQFARRALFAKPS